ncbi:helix-turn-helix transcriptional regulator [Mycobacterium sp. M1]|uniref:Helix-turn-helix transcriptional regulator n=1 Tax=Mycolicibacter acidiphilus TaxID=2835306 RepID=A0ABS5RMQ9_9MYCO|nr:helix-turn-helix transcriptional regulator [Mycolicibacter acidiphilus]MBS9535585.1 helix-turn-helix transcriptional regulator [Mycolicibacter acidiphilus]
MYQQQPHSDDEMILLRVIGKRVELYRELAGMSQRELAEESGVGRSSLRQIEQGVHNPRLLTLARIAQAADTTVAQLLEPPAGTGD